MSESLIKSSPYPGSYAGHVRNLPEECQFGDGLDAEVWDERMHGFEIACGVFGAYLFDPLDVDRDPSPYDDFVFMSEDRTLNGERKEFYIRIDPAWLSELHAAQSEYVDPPEYEEYQIEGTGGLCANVHWSEEKGSYLGRLPVDFGWEVLAPTKDEAKAEIKKAAEEWLAKPDEEFELQPARRILG